MTRRIPPTTGLTINMQGPIRKAAFATIEVECPVHKFFLSLCRPFLPWFLYYLDKTTDNLTCGCGPRTNSGKGGGVPFFVFFAQSVLEKAAL